MDRVHGGERGAGPDRRCGDHAVTEGAPTSTPEVEQPRRQRPVVAEERQRLSDNPDGELDVPGMGRPTEELGPAHGLPDPWLFSGAPPGPPPPPPRRAARAAPPASA